MRSLIYFILTSLFLCHSQLALAGEVNPKGEARLNVLRQYNAQFTHHFFKRLWVFNQNRKDPQFFVKAAKDQASRKHFKKFLEKNRIQEFPEITMHGETAKMQAGGITLEFSILDAFHSRIRVNGHVYQVDSQLALKEFHQDFKEFLKTEVGLTASSHSWGDLFISAAHASEGFELVLGAVMALKIEGDPELEEYDWGAWFGDWFGESHGVEDALEIMSSVKEQKKKCQEEADSQYGTPDAVYVESGKDTAKLFNKLGFYNSGEFKQEKQMELKRLSKELMEYLEHKYGRSSSSVSCEKMSEALFNLNDPSNHPLTNLIDNEGTTVGRRNRENKEEAFINSLCQDIEALETCLARFGVEKMRVHDGSREGKPSSGHNRSVGGSSEGSTSEDR